MEINRINKLVDNDDNDTIYVLSMSYNGSTVWGSEPHINIVYGNFFTTHLEPKLNVISTKYDSLITYYSKKSSDLKKQENKMFNVFKEHLHYKISKANNEIIAVNEEIQNLHNALDTLDFRKHKIKRLLDNEDISRISDNPKQ